MELCSSNHDEVAFEGGRFGSRAKCPVCAVMEELEQAKKELSQERDSYNETLTDLRAELAQLREELKEQSLDQDLST